MAVDRNPALFSADRCDYSYGGCGSIPRFCKTALSIPWGDKAGHFILFGLLSFLLNESALTLLPKRNPARLVLTVSLLLATLIGLEEWSQSLFPARTMSITDLLASYTGVTLFALLAYRTRH
jgi:VanZ family protein